MYEDTVHSSENNSATLALPHRRSLKIEPEIVFGLKQAITSESLDATAALESTEWLALGFEIIDCPFPEWKFQPSDFVASFGLHAALVIGEPKPVQPDMISTLVDQFARFKVRMSRNGEFVEEGSGRNSLRSPALCLAELGAAIVRRFPNEPLSSGEIISSGTLTAGHPTDKGDQWTADVEGLPLPPLKVAHDVIALRKPDSKSALVAGTIRTKPTLLSRTSARTCLWQVTQCVVLRSWKRRVRLASNSAGFADRAGCCRSGQS